MVGARRDRDEEWESVRIPVGAQAAESASDTVAVALDRAGVHLLRGDPARALAAIDLGVRGGDGLPSGARRLLGACVEAAPRSWPTALRVVVTTGSPRQRLLGLIGVGAALSRRGRRRWRRAHEVAGGGSPSRCRGNE